MTGSLEAKRPEAPTRDAHSSAMNISLRSKTLHPIAPATLPALLSGCASPPFDRAYRFQLRTLAGPQ
jgi:hypothetical protein